MIRKFAKADILDVRYSSNKLSAEQLGDGFSKLAKPSAITEDGYLYVTVRAISSRVNKNNDGWPSMELARTDPGYGYKTFEGRPIFVDHNNDDPERTRGVVVSSKLHVDDEKKAGLDPYYATAPDNHKPPTWIELMLEVDAKEFPRLAKEITSGNIDSVSMGANIETSKCSVCGHEAENPTEYCTHVQMKGATFEVTSDNGEKSHKKAYEDCYGINFFEISFVFDPADETALVSDMSAERKAALQTIDILESQGLPVPPELRKQAAGGVYDQEDEDDERGQVPGEHEEDLYGEGEDMPMEPKKDEAAQVHDWRIEQFINLGLSGQEAEWAVAEGIDWHDLANFIAEHPSATPDQALRIMTPRYFTPQNEMRELQIAKTAAAEYYQRDLELMKLGDNGVEAAALFRKLRVDGVPTREAMQQVADRFFAGNYGEAQAAVSRNVQLTGATTPKVAIGPDGHDHHNLEHQRQDVERERQLNHEPQADKVNAPNQVDTLRPEVICKNCGSTVEPDSAGQLICQECGVEVEPQGLDNPDLDLAKDIDLRQDKTEEVNPEGEMETELEPDKGETPEESKSPVRPVAPISSTVSDPVKSEMKFADVDTQVAETRPEVVEAAASFIEAKGIEVEDEVELARILTESKEFDGTPDIFEAAAAIEKVAATQDNSDSSTEVKVNTDKKRPNNSAATQAASEKIISDQLAPVESKFETLAETESEENTMANDKTADRETIKREETDASGVKRTEEITKEYGPLPGGEEPVAESEEAPEGEEAEGEAPAEGEEGESSEPKGEGDSSEVSAEGEESESDGFSPDHNLTEEEKVPAMASNEEGKLMAALKLAKLASALGVISSDEELEFAGELESNETLAEIEARTKMLTSVKEAGLAKKRRPVVAGRLPAFTSSNGGGESGADDTDPSDLFL